jgi:hypothetical protein
MQKVSLYTELEYAFLFTLRKVNSINTAGFKPFFEDLPIDPYVKGEYRSRRLSRFKVSGVDTPRSKDTGILHSLTRH